MPESTNCPFCNAAIPVPVADPVSGKIHCPRCDEAFTARTRSAAVSGPAEPMIGKEVERHREARQPSGWRSPKGLIIGAVLFVILGAAAGLGINYWKRDKNQQPPHAQIETAKPVAPADMPGLCYLPAGTDSVIAVQFRPLLAALPDGQTKDPRALLGWIGLPAEALNALEKILPIGLEQIDQLVLGLKLKDGGLLKQIVLVVHTREAFSMPALVNKLKAKEQKSGDRTTYLAPGTPKFPLDLHLSAPNDRVLVVALEAKDIESPREGVEHLAPRLVEIARNQFAPDTYFWAVLDSERWEVLGLFLLGLAPEQRQAVEKLNISLSVVRTVTLAVRVEPEPALIVWFEFKSESAAQEFRAYVSGRLNYDGANVAIGGAGNRVMVQTPIQSGELRSLMQKLLPPVKK